MDSYIQFGCQRAIFHFPALEQAFPDLTLFILPESRPQDRSFSKNALFGEVGLGDAPRLFGKL